MAWSMVETGCSQMFKENDYFERIYKALLEQDYRELERIGNSLKGAAR